MAQLNASISVQDLERPHAGIAVSDTLLPAVPDSRESLKVRPVDMVISAMGRIGFRPVEFGDGFLRFIRSFDDFEPCIHTVGKFVRDEDYDAVLKFIVGES